MKRSLKDFFSVNSLSHLRYVPDMVRSIKNWPLFLYRYVGLGPKGEAAETTFVFRDGLRVKTASYFDVLTVAVVFMKKDYGQVPEDGVIIDIGANIGAFSLYAAANSRNTIIYSFEPMRANFELLSENINANSLAERVKPFQLGLAAKAGTHRLYLSGSPFHSLYTENEGAEFVDIECATLADIFESNGLGTVDMLKLDCEGAEFEILYELPDEYFARIKEIRMEYHNQTDPEKNIETLEKRLQEQGFKIDYFRRDSNHSGNIWLSRA